MSSSCSFARRISRKGEATKKAVAVADKATEEEATKQLAEQTMSAEEATPAKATKE